MAAVSRPSRRISTRRVTASPSVGAAASTKVSAAFPLGGTSRLSRRATAPSGTPLPALLKGAFMLPGRDAVPRGRVSSASRSASYSKGAPSKKPAARHMAARPPAAGG